jgi:phospholipid/cholesterol/gamma-HCH transport system substrate-binding protein
MNRVKINMVAFLVLSLGFTYWLATQVLSSLQDRIQVYVMLDDAGGVFTSQEVTYRGLTVGQVGTMSVVDDGVKLELNINAENNIPKEDIEARVMFKSAVGEQFVDLLPGSNDPPYLEDGDTIPKEQTSIPVSTQELLTTVEAVLRGVPPEDLKGAIDALGGGLTGRGPDIATIIEATADIAEVFAERGQEIEGILKNGTRLGRAFLDSKEEFAEAVHQLVTVSESLASSTPDLERLMRGGNMTSKEVVALLREHNTGVNRFLHEFAEVNELQAQHGDDIGQLLRFLPDGLLGVVRTFEPETGLVRFSLVEDMENPACSYGTGRRPPSDRSTGLPPKDARCGRAGGSSASTQTGGTSAENASGPTKETVIRGLDLGDVNGGGPVLPPRMAEWSWTLFYLNSV